MSLVFQVLFERDHAEKGRRRMAGLLLLLILFWNVSWLQRSGFVTNDTYEHVYVWIVRCRPFRPWVKKTGVV